MPWQMSAEAVAWRERTCREAANACTRRDNQRDATDYEVTMRAFKTIPFGNKLKWEFLVALWQMQWPDFVQIENLSVENTWLLRIAKACTRFKRITACGCASCVSGDTKIYDPITGKSPSIESLYLENKSPWVMTLLGPRRASVPFSKGIAQLYKVKLSTGECFECTANHRVLTSKGYLQVRDLVCGDALYTYSHIPQDSISEPAQSIHGEDARNFQKTTGGFPASYSTCFHPYGEPLHLEANTARSFAPLPNGAPACNGYAFSHADDHGSLSRDSHLCLPPHRLSNDGILDPFGWLENDDQHHCVSRTDEPGFRWFPPRDLSHSDRLLRLPFSKPIPDEAHNDFACEASQHNSMFPWGIKVSHGLVESIRRTEVKEFFDLMVPDAHHYFAQGAIHHNSGKTMVFSMYCYTMWKCFPTNASVYSSTTSGEAGEARAWGAIKDLFSRDQYRWGRRLDSLQLITLDAEVKDEDGKNNRDLRDAIKVVKIKPGQEGQNVIATMCGRKNDHVIWHCDEFSHMDLGVLDGRVNLFSNDFPQFIGTGNGPNEGDPLYIDAEPFGPQFPDGWRSVDKDVHEWWPTRTGICLYFNGEKSPNMKVPKGQQVPFPKLMNWRMREEILTTAFGEEDSPIFWKMFYGFPPSVDVPDKVVTHSLLQKFRAFEQPEWLGYDVKKLAGLDVGFRKDGDPCVIHFGDVGKSADDKLILGCDPDGRVLQPDQRLQEPFETQIARRVVDECERRGCHDLAMDISSDGGMLLQAIEKEARARGYTLNVLPVSSLGSPDDTLFIPGDKRTAKEACDRKVSQLWLQFRNLVGMGAIRGLGPQSKAVRELCGRKFQTDAKRKFSIEPKKDYKVRLKHSPDHADSVIYLTHLALKNGLSGSEGRSSPTPKPKGDIFTDPNQPAAHYQGHTSRNAYSGR